MDRISCFYSILSNMTRKIFLVEYNELELNCTLIFVDIDLNLQGEQQCEGGFQT